MITYWERAGKREQLDEKLKQEEEMARNLQGKGPLAELRAEMATKEFNDRINTDMLAVPKQQSKAGPATVQIRESAAGSEVRLRRLWKMKPKNDGVSSRSRMCHSVLYL